MPFGLSSNVPSTFERLMEAVYLDDKVIFARTDEELIARIGEVFTRLGQAGLMLMPRKCSLFARETEYHVQVVSGASVAVSPEKIAARTEWPVPANVTEVRSFLETASYYRRFVRNFATVASPLHNLTVRGAEWCWKEEH
jgi:hypothetical protein